jgi:hypothetical protein
VQHSQSPIDAEDRSGDEYNRITSGRVFLRRNIKTVGILGPAISPVLKKSGE